MLDVARPKRRRARIGRAEIFVQRETIPAEELARLINPDQKGNLHDLAWDAADAAVSRMRLRSKLLELLRARGGQ